jgi:hypothetical protein
MTRLRLCNMLHPSCYQSIHDGGHARRPTLGEAWTEMSIRSSAPFRWPVGGNCQRALMLSTGWCGMNLDMSTLNTQAPTVYAECN